MAININEVFQRVARYVEHPNETNNIELNELETEVYRVLENPQHERYGEAYQALLNIGVARGQQPMFFNQDIDPLNNLDAFEELQGNAQLNEAIEEEQAGEPTLRQANNGDQLPVQAPEAPVPQPTAATEAKKPLLERIWAAVTSALQIFINWILSVVFCRPRVAGTVDSYPREQFGQELR